MARLLLGVSGGIAAYKALETARLAVTSGHAVRVIQTPAGQRFVGKASFEAITGPVRAVAIDRERLVLDHHRLGGRCWRASSSPRSRGPAGHTVATRTLKGGQIARFGALCAACPLAAKCTTSLGTHDPSRRARAPSRRRTRPTIRSRLEDRLHAVPADSRAQDRHLARRKHGGRRARVRGTRRSPPTSNSSLPPSTSPDWECSDSPAKVADGRSAQAERRYQRGNRPPTTPIPPQSRTPFTPHRLSNRPGSD